MSVIVKSPLESNIWKYTLLLIANKRIFVAILGAYQLTIPNVNAWWIGVFLLLGNAANFLFDIPSSYIADKIGHKDALILARLFSFLSTAAFLFADSISWLALAAVLMSAGFAFQSGTGSAFMHETLRQLGRENEYRKLAGRASSIGFAIPAVLMAIVPFSISISYKAPFLIALAMDLFGIIVALSLVRPAVSPERVSEVSGTTFLQVIHQGLFLRFFRIALFSGVVSALLDGIDGFRAPYQVWLGVPVIWFGVFFGTGRGLAALMLAHTEKLHHFIGDVYSYQRLQLIIYTLLIFTIGIFGNPWVAVVVYMIDNGLQFGTSQLDTGYLLDIIRDNKFKATLLSVSNQMENVLAMIVVFCMGAAIQYFGYRHSFIVLGILFLCVLAPLYIYIERNAKKQKVHAAH